jgi:hypothetical protein
MRKRDRADEDIKDAAEFSQLVKRLARSVMINPDGEICQEKEEVHIVTPPPLDLPGGVVGERTADDDTSTSVESADTITTCEVGGLGGDGVRPTINQRGEFIERARELTANSTPPRSPHPSTNTDFIETHFGDNNPRRLNLRRKASTSPREPNSGSYADRMTRARSNTADLSGLHPGLPDVPTPGPHPLDLLSGQFFLPAGLRGDGYGYGVGAGAGDGSGRKYDDLSSPVSVMNMSAGDGQPSSSISAFALPILPGTGTGTGTATAAPLALTWPVPTPSISASTSSISARPAPPPVDTASHVDGMEVDNEGVVFARRSDRLGCRAASSTGVDHRHAYQGSHDEEGYFADRDCKGGSHSCGGSGSYGNGVDGRGDTHGHATDGEARVVQGQGQGQGRSPRLARDLSHSEFFSLEPSRGAGLGRRHSLGSVTEAADGGLLGTTVPTDTPRTADFF